MLFHALIQEVDVSPRFKIDMPSKLMTVTDEQATPRTRVKIGKLGAGAADYGLEIFTNTGTDLFRALSGGFGAGVGMKSAAFWEHLGNYFPSGGPSPGLFDGQYALLGRGGLVFADAGVNTTRTYAIDIADYGTSSARLRALGSGAQSAKRFVWSDGSTNEADMATIVVSTLNPSGDYPERTLWAKV